MKFFLIIYIIIVKIKINSLYLKEEAFKNYLKKFFNYFLLKFFILRKYLIIIKFEFKMSKIKILILGPQKAGKSTIANILGDL